MRLDAGLCRRGVGPNFADDEPFILRQIELGDQHVARPGERDAEPIGDSREVAAEATAEAGHAGAEAAAEPPSAKVPAEAAEALTEIGRGRAFFELPCEPELFVDHRLAQIVDLADALDGDLEFVARIDGRRAAVDLDGR